jgi:hypothetical protein
MMVDDRSLCVTAAVRGYQEQDIAENCLRAKTMMRRDKDIKPRDRGKNKDKDLIDQWGGFNLYRIDINAKVL